jgi:hypothetical protein
MGCLLVFSCVSWWAVASAQIPVLQVSPLGVEFAVEGRADPAPQQVRIRNLGSGVLRWTASPATPWLRVSPRAGSGPAVLTIEIDRASLAPGRHEARIIIDAGDADDSPVSVAVTVDVAASASSAAPKHDAPTAGATGAAASPPPAAGPTSKAGAAPSRGAGAAQPAPESAPDPLRIDRRTLPPATRNLPYAQAVPIVGGTPPYAIRIVEGRLPPGLVLAQGSISGVSRVQGNYPFAVAVTDASKPPATIVQPLAIRVIILQADTALVVSPPSVAFRLPGRSRDGRAALGITSGRQVLEWTASADVPWLRIVPASGVSPAKVEIVALGGQLSPGTHACTLTVTMEGAPNSPASIPVQVTVPR